MTCMAATRSKAWALQDQALALLCGPSVMRRDHMQELDVQNKAAAEQHSKDMVEYEAKVAEAAAAWEADKKKRKGKAKDEAS